MCLSQFPTGSADTPQIRIINEVFDSLGWRGTYTIKLNTRKILDGIFQVCGVPEALLRPISSAVDKLDKMPWEDVRKEMVDDKGLDPAIADKIGKVLWSHNARKADFWHRQICCPQGTA